MQLVVGSFGGLVTRGLYLHDCSLRHLSQTVLYPLNSTVKYLWLNGNDIASLDPRLQSVFADLQHLRLGENPLRCDCSAVWLKQLYDRRREMFRGAPAPTCHSPDRLRGRAFNETTVDEFLCRAPQLTRVEVTANNTSGRLTCAAAGEPVPTIYWINTSGRLTCVAAGEPVPTIYWIQPSGRATRYLHSEPDPDLQPSAAAADPSLENEGTLMVESFNSDNRLFGMYICVANNDAGNVTLTISVPASTSDLLRPAVYLTSTPSTFTISVPASTSDLLRPAVYLTSTLSTLLPVNATVSQSTEPSTTVDRRSSTEADMQAVTASSRRSFTLSQLVVAVVVTHIVTLLLYVVVVAVCYWRRCGVDEFNRRRKNCVRRVHHQRSTVCSASSGSTLYTGGTAKLSPLPQSPSCGSPQRQAAVYLNGLGAHRDFFFETAADYGFRDGEYG